MIFKKMLLGFYQAQCFKKHFFIVLIFLISSCSTRENRVVVEGVYVNDQERIELNKNRRYKQFYELKVVNTGKYYFDSLGKNVVFDNFLSLKCCYPSYEGWIDKGEIFTLEAQFYTNGFNTYLVPFEEDSSLSFKKIADQE